VGQATVFRGLSTTLSQPYAKTGRHAAAAACASQVACSGFQNRNTISHRRQSREIRIKARTDTSNKQPLILYSLKSGACRYGELRRRIPEPSEKVLLQQLRQLESDGVIERLVTPGKTQKVSYQFTAYGQTLNTILRAMAEWGVKHRQRVE
jgi:DNA-binding HxlR family transcriptional regulator